MTRRNPLMPVVTVYPRCSECSTPYVLRHGFAVMEGCKEVWTWMRDCKHKNAPPVTSEPSKAEGRDAR